MVAVWAYSLLVEHVQESTSQGLPMSMSSHPIVDPSQSTEGNTKVDEIIKNLDVSISWSLTYGETAMFAGDEHMEKIWWIRATTLRDVKKMIQELVGQQDAGVK